MRIAARIDDDLAGFERQRFPVQHGGEAAALGHHVIGDQVAGTGQDLPQHGVAWRLLRGPGMEAGTQVRVAYQATYQYFGKP